MTEKNLTNVTITMSKDEKKKLKQLALDQELTVSALVRIWLKDQHVADINREKK